MTAANLKPVKVLAGTRAGVMDSCVSPPDKGAKTRRSRKSGPGRLDPPGFTFISSENEPEDGEETKGEMRRDRRREAEED